MVAFVLLEQVQRCSLIVLKGIIVLHKQPVTLCTTILVIRDFIAKVKQVSQQRQETIALKRICSPPGTGI